MSTATNPVDAGIAFRTAMFDAIRTIFAADEYIYVTRTVIAKQSEDIVLLGAVDGIREDAPNSASLRTQDWDLSIDVHAYAVRAGGADVEQKADDDAYAAAASYLSRVAEYVRRQSPNGDTTLGGTVMWCRMESFNTVPGSAQSASGVGRMWEFIGTFVARSRVTG